MSNNLAVRIALIDEAGRIVDVDGNELTPDEYAKMLDPMVLVERAVREWEAQSGLVDAADLINRIRGSFEEFAA